MCVSFKSLQLVWAASLSYGLSALVVSSLSATLTRRTSKQLLTQADLRHLAITLCTLLPSVVQLAALRGRADSALVGGLVVDSVRAHFQLLSFMLCGLTLWQLIRPAQAASTVWGGYDVSFSIVWLFWAWAIVALVTDFMGLLLCLEIASLLLLQALIVTNLASQPAAGLSPVQLSPRTDLRAPMFLFWATSFSTLFVLWAIASCFGSDSRLATLSISSHGATSLHHPWTPTAATFTAALLLKVYLAPFQLVLLTLYRSFSAYNLATYLLAYYLPFLLLVLFALFHTLAGLGAQVAYLAIGTALSVGGIVVVLSRLSSDPRDVLALSTLVSLALLSLLLSVVC